MQRGSFFKSLATLIVAPKILAQIDWTKAITKAKPPTMGLFNDLRLLTPTYYKNYLEKYGDKNFGEFLSKYEGMEMVDRKFSFYDLEKGEVIQGAEPISATITL